MTDVAEDLKQEVVEMPRKSKAIVIEQVPSPPAPIDETAAVLSMIERAARDPQVDLDKMERLFKMHEMMSERRAKAAFAEALAAMQAELPTVVALGKITGEDKHSGDKITRSRYAKWEDVNEAIRPVLCKNGFALSFRIGQPQPDRVSVTAVLTHKAGHGEETSLHLPNDPSGGKNNVQAWGSSVSYGKRYTAFALLNIASRGEDDDGKACASVASITEDQESDLIDMLEATGSDRKQFLAYFKIATVADLPAKDFDRAMGALKKKRAQNNG